MQPSFAIVLTCLLLPARSSGGGGGGGGGGVRFLAIHAAWLQPAAAVAVNIVSFLIKNYSPDCRFKSGFSIVTRVYTNSIPNGF